MEDGGAEGRSVQVGLDGAAWARVEAAAAARHLTVAALVEGHLRDVAREVTAVALPLGAVQPFLRMFRHEGRDLVAKHLADGAWDAFESPMPTYVYHWLRQRPGLMVDGGANTGFYALLAAAADPGVRVLAFEPDPVVLGLLRANVAANGMEGRITVHDAALSDGVGRAPLYVPPQDLGVIETSSSLDAGFKDRSSEVIEVATTTVDAAVGTGEVVRVLKLDVAGHEAAALAGAEGVVARDRPLIFAEVLDVADMGALSRFVARHNYMDVPLWAHGRLFPRVEVGAEGDAWNHAFVPSEVLPAFLRLGRAGR